MKLLMATRASGDVLDYAQYTLPILRRYYDFGVDVKKLIENCGVPISYKPKETPGCEEFKTLPEHAWQAMCPKAKRMVSRIAFFNEK